MLISTLLVGMKLTAAKELVQTIERRKELKVNLSLLQRETEKENHAIWIGDVTQDAQQRTGRIAELVLPSGCVYDTMENQAIQKCLDMFALFDNGSAGVTKLHHSATITRLETKQDVATSILLGRAEAEVRAELLHIVAYLLHVDSRWFQSLDAANPDVVRSECLAMINPHHSIAFVRYKARGIRDRTFLMSVIAKQVAKDPPTFVVAVVPIPGHDKIGKKDEVGAIRAENCRSFRCIGLAEGLTKVVLNLVGW